MSIKTLFDLSLSIIIILLLSPLMIGIAAVIWVVLGRPIIYEQKRPGLNCMSFNIYKFRSMTNQQDADGNLLTDSQRLTAFGRFLRSTSLDELPELINVLKSDMSLVGPRPLLMEYLPLYNLKQARRHEVKPGITGWAQVNGRNAISWEEKFNLDVWYVDNQSFLLDMKIVWMTIIKIIKREGISQEGHATMEKFTGSGGGK